jgi:hypothetical protein
MVLRSCGVALHHAASSWHADSITTDTPSSARKRAAVGHETRCVRRDSCTNEAMPPKPSPPRHACLRPPARWIEARAAPGKLCPSSASAVSPGRVRLARGGRPASDVGSASQRSPEHLATGLFGSPRRCRWPADLEHALLHGPTRPEAGAASSRPSVSCTGDPATSSYAPCDAHSG